MNILITSGGTKVPIDRVRDITNKSGGNFASKIANAFFDLSNEIPNITFLRAENSVSPFDFKINWYKYGTENIGDALSEFTHGFKRWEKFGEYYREYEYVNFKDYKQKFFNLLISREWDIVVVAAAVSDYLVKNYVDGKIRSGQQYSIELEDAEKIITQVKDICPDCRLIGFKLLVDSTEEQLLAAANKVLCDAKCDFVVANDMRDIQSDNHKITLCYPNAGIRRSGKSEALARFIVCNALEGCKNARQQ